MLRSRFSAIVSLVLVFASGAVFGGFVNRLYMMRSVSAVAPQRNPEEWRKRYVGEMRDHLKLDDRQVARLQQILDETRQRFHQMREQEKPLAQSIQNEQIANIKAMLTPEQVGLYDQFREQREKKRQDSDRRKGPGSGGGRGGPGGPPQ